jgi:Xaa-Pro aminopeptidase
VSAEAARQERLLARLEADGLDAVLISDPTNVRYLTGYVGSNALALLGPEVRVLLTDSRYSVSAREQVRGADVLIGRRDLLDDTATAAGALGGGARIGFESRSLTVARHARVVEALDGHELVATEGVVEDLRVIKDPSEVALIRESAAITDRALGAVMAEGLVGRTEREVAWAIEGALREAGAEGASFAPIVAAGPRGARPHAVPGDDPIPDDTLVVVDMGAVWHGYCSDMTRTFILGRPPPELVEAYRLCHRAQRTAVEAVRPGITAADLDGVARSIIEDGGMGEAFGHGLGHGVGLDIHERPGVRSESDETIGAGMAITIEPGIYLEGLGGVRIEDLVVVTEDGAEVVSGFPVPEPPARK